MNTPSANKVAVVIPMWNSAQFGRGALDAVARQTRAPDKLVVVDDGSTDGTDEMVRRWMAQHPEVNTQLIRQNNRGPGHARNTGLRAVGDADFIAFIDSDDEILANFLEITTAAMVANDDVVLVATNVQRYPVEDYLPKSASGEPLPMPDSPDPPGYYNTEILCNQPRIEQLMEGSGFLSCALLRAKDARAVGGFDERLFTGQDTRFFFLLAERGRWLHVDECAVEVYRNKKACLFDNCDDARRRWALLFEYELMRDDKLKLWQVWKTEVRLLAARWVSAGEMFEEQWRVRDALYCYLLALLRNPLRIWNAGYLVRILVGGLYKACVMAPALVGGVIGRQPIARREDD